MKLFVASACGVLTLSLVAGVFGSPLGEKAKFSISETMLEVQKSGVAAKVAKGEGDEKEKKLVLEHYTSLNKNKPPKGDEKEWKTKTEAMVKAAKAAVDGDKDAPKLFKAAGATNCGGCHKVFK